MTLEVGEDYAAAYAGQRRRDAKERRAGDRRHRGRRATTRAALRQPSPSSRARAARRLYRRHRRSDVHRRRADPFPHRQLQRHDARVGEDYARRTATTPTRRKRAAHPPPSSSRASATTRAARRHPLPSCRARYKTVSSPPSQTRRTRVTPSAPAPEVTYNGMTLRAEEDHTVVYEENIDAGEALVRLAGVGNYTGSAEASFTILPRTVDESFTFVIAGGDTVGFLKKYRRRRLRAGRDLPSPPPWAEVSLARRARLLRHLAGRRRAARGGHPAVRPNHHRRRHGRRQLCGHLRPRRRGQPAAHLGGARFGGRRKQLL